MKIVRLQPGDALQVASLFNDYRIFYKQLSDIALAEKFITKRLANNESVIFVAVATVSGSDLPVGFTQLYPTYSSVKAIKNWILNDLFVAENYRTSGIGTQLIQTAMAFARESAAKYLQLETTSDNIIGQKLYESIGFEKIAPDAGFYMYRISL